MTPLTGSRRVATIDSVGQVRTGPPGAWWPNLAKKTAHLVGDVLMAEEMPRATAWNVAFVTMESGLIFWARYAGNSWEAIAIVLATTLAAGVWTVVWFLIVYTPRARAREAARIRATQHAARKRREARQDDQPQSTGQPPHARQLAQTPSR